MDPSQLGRYLSYRRKIVDRELRKLSGGRTPGLLAGPHRHALAPGGKRLRALLVLLACDAVGGAWKPALPAAVALECLHNFTLIHDDVMDRSAVRRGRPTVHTRWSEPVAILAGDHLLSLGYRQLLRTGGGRGAAGELLRIYSDAFRDVCEGQAYDLAFETRRRITMREYRRMIDLKTGRVIAAAAEIGALAGGASAAEAAALRAFGGRIGLAFQIRDDVLDVTGDAGEFGKKIGGDIARGKKTYLLVTAMETARGADAALLRRVAAGDGAGLTARVRAVYRRTGAIDRAAGEIGTLTAAAAAALRPIAEGPGRKALLLLADRLAGRTA